MTRDPARATLPSVALRTFATTICLVLAIAASASARTRVVTYSPFAADGSVRPGLNIAPRQGTCWTTPEAPVAGLAYRCMGGNFIYDPCFRPPGGLDPRAPSVVCASSPWARTVIRLHLRSRPHFKATSSPNRRLPWAMTLASGDRCVFVEGASAVDRAGRRFNYACTRGRRATWWLFGVVDRSRPVWRIRGGRPTSPAGPYRRTERWLDVRTAWR